ncbi:uncharacterized protein LOC124155987 isoform X2 [Ischnura elegans]|uniref:uncharacterized protein LOC124155987 isoform X2 n=1 Tax=Ischnura elegans TaxID=197161 RepID=UPI001ED895D2|nr:uncharacterized protein LOC124155987 isoform X2 [Ischnura elegans]
MAFPRDLQAGTSSSTPPAHPILLLASSLLLALSIQSAHSFQHASLTSSHYNQHHHPAQLHLALVSRDDPALLKAFEKSVLNSSTLAVGAVSLQPLPILLPRGERNGSNVLLSGASRWCDAVKGRRVVATVVLGIGARRGYTTALASSSAGVPVLSWPGFEPGQRAYYSPLELSQLEVRYGPSEIAVAKALKVLLLGSYWRCVAVVSDPSPAATQLRMAFVHELNEPSSHRPSQHRTQHTSVPAHLAPSVVVLPSDSKDDLRAGLRRLLQVSEEARAKALPSIIHEYGDNREDGGNWEYSEFEDAPGVSVFFGSASFVRRLLKEASLLDAEEDLGVGLAVSGDWEWLWVDTNAGVGVKPVRRHAASCSNGTASAAAGEGKRPPETSGSPAGSATAVPHLTSSAATLPTALGWSPRLGEMTPLTPLPPLGRFQRSATGDHPMLTMQSDGEAEEDGDGEKSEEEGEHDFEEEENTGEDLAPVGLLQLVPRTSTRLWAGSGRKALRASVEVAVDAVRLALTRMKTPLAAYGGAKNGSDPLVVDCWNEPSKQLKNFSTVVHSALKEATDVALSMNTTFDLLSLIGLRREDRSFHPSLRRPPPLARALWRSIANISSGVLNRAPLSSTEASASFGVFPNPRRRRRRLRTVYRVVTALAPPFVMASKSEPKIPPSSTRRHYRKCLRGVVCHRVSSSVDPEALAAAFARLDSRGRLRRGPPSGGSPPTHSTQPPIDLLLNTTCCYGFAIDLLADVASHLRFEFHLYLVPDGAFGSQVKDKLKDDSSGRRTRGRRSSHQRGETPEDEEKWDGIMGDLISGAAHMAFAPLSVSAARERVVHFSVPFYYGGGVSFLASTVPPPTAPPGTSPPLMSNPPLLGFLLPFSPGLWAVAIASLHFTALAVATFEWLSPFGLNPWGRRRSRNFGLASALWVLWALLCGHLVAFKAPKSWPNKFLINVWGGFSVIFVASYTAHIAALIAGLFFRPTVTDYNDKRLLQLRVGAPRSSAVEYYVQKANYELYQHIQDTPVSDIEEGIRRLRDGSLDVLMGDSAILDYYRGSDPGCTLVKRGIITNEDTYAVAMSKNFPLKRSITATVSEYGSNGHLDILMRRWFGPLPCFRGSVGGGEDEMAAPRPLGIAAVAGVFLMLCVGVGVASIILCGEHLFYRHSLPALRKRPHDSVWRSRNLMFFSQKLYRFINCVELVSPHHAARELVHTLRQGQITSLFQKSVKREHEQRRRRKSKAQFFEMIQEIRRVQQEEKQVDLAAATTLTVVRECEETNPNVPNMYPKPLTLLRQTGAPPALLPELIKQTPLAACIRSHLAQQRSLQESSSTEEDDDEVMTVIEERDNDPIGRVTIMSGRIPEEIEEVEEDEEEAGKIEENEINIEVSTTDSKTPTCELRRRPRTVYFSPSVESSNKEDEEVLEEEVPKSTFQNSTQILERWRLSERRLRFRLASALRECEELRHRVRTLEATGVSAPENACHSTEPP